MRRSQRREGPGLDEPEPRRRRIEQRGQIRPAPDDDEDEGARRASRPRLGEAIAEVVRDESQIDDDVRLLVVPTPAQDEGAPEGDDGASSEEEQYGAASVQGWRAPRAEALEELRQALDPASTEQVRLWAARTGSSPPASGAGWSRRAPCHRCQARSPPASRAARRAACHRAEQRVSTGVCGGIKGRRNFTK